MSPVVFGACTGTISVPWVTRPPPAEPKPEEVAVKLEELTEEPRPIPVEPEQPAKPRQNDEEINSKLNDILGNRK